MKVQDRMTANPVTVGADASVDQALGLMRKHGIRHLPVMDAKEVAGLVTDSDLATAWFPSLLEEVNVGDVMQSQPMVIGPDETVYQAARLIYHKKLTGLLVVEEGELLGILTLADLLELFIGLLGVLSESNRLDVALRPGDNSLEEVHGAINRLGGEVISVALLSSQPPQRTYSFRLAQTDIEPIAQALRAQGHEVLSQ